MRASVKVLGLTRSEVRLSNGTVVFFSYQTPVAAVHEGKLYITDKKYSQTTSKHISIWTRGKGRDAVSASEEFLAKLLPRAAVHNSSQEILDALLVLRSTLTPYMGQLPDVAMHKLSEALDLIAKENSEEQ